MSELPFPIGAVIGYNRYRIEAVLGAGGAGVVYRALHIELHIQVAIKVSAISDVASLAALREEAQLLSRLKHNHLPLVADFFVEDHWPCLVMEYIDGSDLEQERKRHGGQCSKADVVRWTSQVAEALSYLHHQQPRIIHRDVKPANIRLRRNGAAILVDFGIAKRGGADTKTRALVSSMGTPPYAPWEQYGGEATDAYSDVYALGATMYILLTGYPPPDALTRKAGDGSLPPPSVVRPGINAQLERIILKSMAMAPGERYQDAGDLLTALHELIAASSLEAIGPTQRLATLRQCPQCSSTQQVPHAVFCQQCGALLVLKFSRSNRLLIAVADLTTTCDEDWESAVDHLATGRLTRWLEARNEQLLLARLKQELTSYPEHHAAALEAWLRPGIPADLSANQSVLDFGEQSPEAQPVLRCLIQSGSPGYIHGSIEVVGNWLAVTPTTFQVLPNQPIPPITVRAKQAFMTPGEVERLYTGALKISSNRGALLLSARLVVRNPPRVEVLTPSMHLGKVDAQQRIDARATITNAGGGCIHGCVSGRQPWIMVESQQSRYVLRRGEQHTVNFSVDTRHIPTQGRQDGTLLWETDQGSALTRLTIEIIPPMNVDPHDPTTAVHQPKDLIHLCDYVRGGVPHRWEQGLSWLQNGRLAAALRFLGDERLACEAESLAQLADANIGLERLLRHLGARQAHDFRDNGNVISKQVTESIKRAPSELFFGILNTSKRGYLHGFVRPLVNWISIPAPRFGCLPGQESVIRLIPDYTHRINPPFFGSVTLLEVVVE